MVIYYMGVLHCYIVTVLYVLAEFHATKSDKVQTAIRFVSRVLLSPYSIWNPGVDKVCMFDLCQCLLCYTY